MKCKTEIVTRVWLWNRSTRCSTQPLWDCSIQMNLKRVRTTVDLIDRSSFASFTNQYPEKDNKMDITALDGVNLTQFAIDTAPKISFLACRIVGINCISKWRPVLTPLGVCYRLDFESWQYFSFLKISEQLDRNPKQTKYARRRPVYASGSAKS